MDALRSTGVRVGWGVDAHRFGGSWPVRLGGVLIESDRLVEATSDGDVACHALVDAVLGAAALGDLGMFYPSSDEQWHGASSTDLLRDAVRRVAEIGWQIDHVDVTVIAQSVRVAPHRDSIRAGLSETMGVPVENVSVKATTTDRMGMIGRDEGLAAAAIAVLIPLADNR